MHTFKLVFVFCLAAVSLHAAEAPATGPAPTPWIAFASRPGDFPLAPAGQTTPIVADPADFKVVQIATSLFAEDVERVTGRKPAILDSAAKLSGPAVIVGTLGHSAVLDKLVADKKLDVSKLTGQWESFLIATVANPLPNVPQALVIAGSDRRGTAFGIFEVSQAIGVSPWYWWADVTPTHRDSLFVAAGTRRFGPPSVQYRGIFINDEDWGLVPWASKTFEPEVGNLGPKTYAKVCELLLRLKANTLWPGMHEVSTPFNAIPENRVVADNYGIVMGSSHCEPMLRNNVGEWPANNQAAFNFISNPEGVTQYWEQRMKENGPYENIYTIGMRGIHDGAMQGPRTPAEHVATLEKIFPVQRDLISKYVNPDPSKVPQIFCPYKEVLAYYLNGLKIPSDVTLVFPDDNYGYIRYFPSAKEVAERPGGFGVYYHISYLGNPASYVWLETTPPALIWEEMSKAYDHGMRKLWIVNVGDIKPGEIGIDLFTQMAWDITRWNRETIPNFLPTWAAQQFGPEHAKDIAAVMSDYYKLAYQRKPEHLQWNVGREAPRLSDLSSAELQERATAYRNLAATADQLMQRLAPAQRDGFYELVAFPVTGAALTNARFAASELSRKPGGESRDWTTWFNDSTTGLTAAIARYNAIGGGKWQNIMYDEPLMRTRSYRTALLAPPSATPPTADPALPAPAPASPSPAALSGNFVESNGVVSIEAEHPTRKIDRPGAAWQVIPGLGRTGDSVAIFPTTAPSVDLAKVGTDAPTLEYNFYTFKSGPATITYNLIPTQPLVYGSGLRYAVSVDNEPPQLVTLTAGIGAEVGYDVNRPAWSKIVMANTNTASTTHTLATPGPHTLKVYAIDPGVVLDKIVLDLGGLQPSYLGPPETLAAVPAGSAVSAK